MQITSKSHHRFFPTFSKYASELSSFTSASLKAIVSVELAAKMLVKFNLKCYANTLSESWRTNRGRVPTDYLLSERILLPKALLQETELSETYGERS